jgi:hypothetical protein
MSTDCMSGATHLELVQYIMDKHPESYRQHVEGVLERKDRDARELVRSCDALERIITEQQEPLLDALRREEKRLADRLRDPGGHPDGPSSAQVTGEQQVSAAGLDAARAGALEKECVRLQNEVEALRGSASWRLTAPVRFLYDSVRWLLRRGRP